MIAQIWLIIALLVSRVTEDVKLPLWNMMSAQEQSEADLEVKAWFASMTAEEFELMSIIVEAESDRSESMEGKKLIALTILNRVESSGFPNSIKGVISQSGQFQVYYEGTYRSIKRTETSDRAVVEAYMWKKQEHPNVIFFNSIGYNGLGQAYDYVDGNYFETA